MSLFENPGIARIISIVVTVAIVLVSTVLHELSHAACALALGDPTAKEQGRLTLNPLKHLHPVGSVLLPILMAVSGGPVFAFAKPVPYNPRRLKRPIVDEVLVALAGPAANLAQALVGTGLFHLLFANYASLPFSTEVSEALLNGLATYIYLNLSLMFFNLIPLPPLDGSAIISPLLRGRAREVYYQVQRYSLPILLGVMYLVPTILHIDPLRTYLNATAARCFYLLLGY